MAEKPDVLAWAVQVGIRYAADRPWYFCNAGQFGKRARCTTRCPMHPSDHPRFRVTRYAAHGPRPRIYRVAGTSSTGFRAAL